MVDVGPCCFESVAYSECIVVLRMLFVQRLSFGPESSACSVCLVVLSSLIVVLVVLRSLLVAFELLYSDQCIICCCCFCRTPD